MGGDDQDLNESRQLEWHQQWLCEGSVSGRGLGLENLATGNAVKSSHTEFSHNWEEF